MLMEPLFQREAIFFSLCLRQMETLIIMYMILMAMLSSTM